MNKGYMFAGGPETAPIVYALYVRRWFVFKYMYLLAYVFVRMFKRICTKYVHMILLVEYFGVFSENYLYMYV